MKVRNFILKDMKIDTKPTCSFLKHMQKRKSKGYKFFIFYFYFILL